MKQVTIKNLVQALSAECDEIQARYIEQATKQSDPAMKSQCHLNAEWNIIRLCDFICKLDGLDAQTRVVVEEIRQGHVDKAEAAIRKLDQQVYVKFAKL